jgi:hypothetical protein
VWDFAVFEEVCGILIESEFVVEFDNVELSIEKSVIVGEFDFLLCFESVTMVILWQI